MKTDLDHASAGGACPQRVPVHFEVTQPTTITLVDASTCNDWRRTAAFLPNPFGGRTLHLQGPLNGQP
jgi:hypothetical protein